LSELNKVLQLYFDSLRELAERIEVAKQILVEFAQSWNDPVIYETQIPILQDYMTVMVNFGKLIF